MDGTIYNGSTLFPATNPFLATLAELHIGHTFLTNNPSKSHADYLAHLRYFGLHATAENLYTSAQATIQFLQNLQPAPKRLFVLGTPSMCAEFSTAGFQLLPDDPDQPPDAVVVGFDTTLNYPRLCRAAWWISRGKPFIATNPDRVCPTDQPTVLVDCGSICAMLQTATGRAPDAVMGKPDPAMLRGILERHQLQPSQLAMVGDRLYTDMEMARRSGAVGILVLTGETTSEQAAASDIPALVVRDLSELAALLRESKK
jgi:HAD superfamily hydrolase (TIGR01450 family)